MFKFLGLFEGCFFYLISVIVAVMSLSFYSNAEFMVEGLLASAVMATLTFLFTDHRRKSLI